MYKTPILAGMLFSGHGCCSSLVLCLQEFLVMHFPDPHMKAGSGVKAHPLEVGLGVKVHPTEAGPGGKPCPMEEVQFLFSRWRPCGCCHLGCKKNVAAAILGCWRDCRAVPSRRAGWHGILTQSGSMGYAGYHSLTAAGHRPVVAMVSRSWRGEL